MDIEQSTFQRPAPQRFIDALNGRYHRAALLALAALVVGHWGEHLAQAFQVWVLGWPRQRSFGLLGLAFPWLVKSEQLHYWIALIMLVGLVSLRRGFTGQARRWWDLAIGIQIWHHFEHLLLLGQVLVATNLLGKPVPTSLLQLAVPRIELHLFYNAVVTVPMVIAVYLHMRPRPEDAAVLQCTCAQPFWRMRIVG